MSLSLVVIDVVVTPDQISPSLDLRISPLSPTAINVLELLPTPRRFCVEYLLAMINPVPIPRGPSCENRIVPPAPTATALLDPATTEFRSVVIVSSVNS